MRKPGSLIFLLLVPLCCLAQNALVIKDVSLIDMVDSNVRTGVTIIINGSTISSVGSKTTIPKNATVIDGKGKYLIPGLWDMHTHTLRPERIEVNFPLFIANGITGIRDMAMPLENLDLLKVWRREIREGTRIGPRIFASGATLGGARRQLTIPVTTEAEARQAVITLKQRGADFIKVVSLLPRAAFLAAADEARKQKLDIVGHADHGSPCQPTVGVCCCLLNRFPGFIFIA